MDNKNVNVSLNDKIIKMANHMLNTGECKEVKEAFQKAWEKWNDEYFDYDMLEIDKQYIMSRIIG